MPARMRRRISRWIAGSCSGTAGTTRFQGNPFANSGTVSLQSGTLSCTAYSQIAGATVVGAGTTFASAGTISIQGGTLSGSGTVNADVSNGGTLGTDPAIGT